MIFKTLAIRLETVRLLADAPFRSRERLIRFARIEATLWMQNNIWD